MASPAPSPRSSTRSSTSRKSGALPSTESLSATSAENSFNSVTGSPRIGPSRKRKSVRRHSYERNTPDKPIPQWRQKLNTMYKAFFEYMAASQAEVELFEIEKESYISIPMGEMLTLLAKTSKKSLPPGDASENFGRFCRSISTYYNVHLESATSELLESYAYFDPLTSEALLNDVKWPENKMRVKEDTVLNMIVCAFQKANYQLLSEESYQLAISQNYRMTVEVDIDRSKLDTQLFDHFFASSKNNDPNRADINDFMLIFHRGVGIDQMTDTFTSEKLNILLSRWWAAIKTLPGKMNKDNALSGMRTMGSVLRRSTDKLRLSDPSLETVLEPAQPEEDVAQPETEAPVAAKVTPPTEVTAMGRAVAFLVTPNGIGMMLVLILGLIHEIVNRMGVGWTGLGVTVVAESLVCYMVFSELSSRSPVDPVDPKRLEKWAERERIRKENPKKEVKDTTTVKRLRLENQPLSIRDLFTATTIQEPTFKDVAIIYRPLGTRHIVMKHFHNIPMADLEVVYPFKVPALNMLDLFILISTIIGGLVSLLLGQSFDEEGLSNDVMYAIALGMLALAAQGYTALQCKKAVYNSVLTSTLYKAQLSNNDTMVLHLMHDCEEQEINEACLAFYIMQSATDPTAGMTAKDIDAAAEAFIAEKFGVDLDFDVTGALAKLKRLNIVKESEGVYVAEPLDSVIGVLTNEWANLDI
eukprot:Ihof_evm2s666 gene=Ihof_evmTU2s666